jgi:hypothetical protein
MCEDLGLSEDSREFLRSADGVAKSTAQVDQLLNGLNKYRQTRVYYKMAKALLRNLELPKIDPDALNELIGKALSSAQLRKAELATVINIGRDSNVREILEKVIYSEDTTNCIPSGFKTFDSVNGGFFRGSLVSIAGNTGSGKCSRPDTLVTLSTLVLTLEDGSCMEFEPEDKLTVTREGATVEIQALDLLPGDDLVNHSLADE